MLQYGHGKERTVRTAKASTDVMTGTMILKVISEVISARFTVNLQVKPDGSAHVKKVVFQKPEQVNSATGFFLPSPDPFLQVEVLHRDRRQAPRQRVISSASSSRPKPFKRPGQTHIQSACNSF